MKKVNPTMKFKTIKKLLLLITCFTVINIVAQNKSIKLTGIVQLDSTYLSDINIINKTTLSGTASDANGRFTLYAKKGDSILFSSLIFENRIIKITETHLKSTSITVYLEPSLNHLDEIMLDKIDWLNSINIAVSKETILDLDEISNRKPPNARKLTDPNANAGGINFIAIITKLTKTLTKKARLRRKAKKLKHEKSQQLKNEFSYTIKNLDGDDFFIDWLYISEEHIYLFLDYCEGNGLLELYDKNEIIIKDFLIKQAKKFNSFRN